MTDTSTKHVGEVALLHAAHAFYGVEPPDTALRALREQTAALLRTLAAERDALRAALQGLVNDLDNYPAVARLLDTYEYARAALKGKGDE